MLEVRKRRFSEGSCNRLICLAGKGFNSQAAGKVDIGLGAAACGWHSAGALTKLRDPQW